MSQIMRLTTQFQIFDLGTVAQAIKAMTFMIEKRRHRKQFDTSHTSIAPQQLPLYSSVCNASSQNALCNNQRHVVYATPCNHSLIPHSKSLDHYNEASKFGDHYHHALSRHSFDQSISSNFKNYDCADGLHLTDRSNGCHYSSIVGGHYQPNKYNLSNAENMYKHPDQTHHYSQIGNYDRIEPSLSSCCHQNSHYDYLFKGRSSQPKSKNTDYSNCSFPSK